QFRRRSKGRLFNGCDSQAEMPLVSPLTWTCSPLTWTGFSDSTCSDLIFSDLIFSDSATGLVSVVDEGITGIALVSTGAETSRVIFVKIGPAAITSGVAW